MIDPDCQQGKHPACVGWCWEDAADRVTDCQCPCHID